MQNGIKIIKSSHVNVLEAPVPLTLLCPKRASTHEKQLKGDKLLSKSDIKA